MTFDRFVMEVDQAIQEAGLDRNEVEIAWIDINCDDISEIEIIRVNGEVQLRVT